MSMEARTVVSPFARTCQAAHILGRVLEHVNEHADASNADYHFQEAQHIARAAEALILMLHDESSATLLEERYTYFLPRALCYSALQVLYDVHSCVEVDEVESVGGNRGLRLDLQQLAIDGFKGVVANVSTFAGELVQAIEMGLLEKISPMVMQCLYSAGGTYAWYTRETGDERHLESLMELRGLLERFKGRWGVAGERRALFHLRCDMTKLMRIFQLSIWIYWWSRSTRFQEQRINKMLVSATYSPRSVFEADAGPRPISSIFLGLSDVLRYRLDCTYTAQRDDSTD